MMGRNVAALDCLHKKCRRNAANNGRNGFAEEHGATQGRVGGHLIPPTDSMERLDFSAASVTVMASEEDWVLVAGLCGTLKVWRAECEADASDRTSVLHRSTERRWVLVATDDSSYSLANGARDPLGTTCCTFVERPPSLHRPQK